MPGKAKHGRKTSVYAMSIEALLGLRDQIANAIESRVADIRSELGRLAGSSPARRRPPARKSRRAAPQFRSNRDPSAIWSGRGLIPRWMKEEMKGTKLKKEDFRIK